MVEVLLAKAVVVLWAVVELIIAVVVGLMLAVVVIYVIAMVAVLYCSHHQHLHDFLLDIMMHILHFCIHCLVSSDNKFDVQFQIKPHAETCIVPKDVRKAHTKTVVKFFCDLHFFPSLGLWFKTQTDRTGVIAITMDNRA